MEITQLHYFKTVAKFESFTRAAEELHITQPALSRSIALLEEDIGFQLFERKRGGRIVLNKEGQLFLTYVIRSLDVLEESVRTVKEMCGMERGSVKIAIGEAIVLDYILLSFMERHPSIRLSCLLQSDQQISESLADNTLDFAVCKNPMHTDNLNWEPLYRDYTSVVLPVDHPLAKESSIHLEQLRNEHFIVSNLSYNAESSIIPLCRQAGFNPQIIFEETGNIGTMLVSRGIGIVLAPFSISQGLALMERDQPRASRVEQNAVAVVPITDEFAASEVGILSRPDRRRSELAQALYQEISDFYTGLPKPY